MSNISGLESVTRERIANEQHSMCSNPSIPNRPYSRRSWDRNGPGAVAPLRYPREKQHTRRLEGGADSGSTDLLVRIPDDLPASIHGRTAIAQECAADMDGIFDWQMGRRHSRGRNDWAERQDLAGH